MPLTTKPADDDEDVKNHKAAKKVERGDDTPPEYQGSLPRVDRDPSEFWQDYAVQAVNAIYPRLQDGVDFAVGRRHYDQDVELLGQGEGVNIDWGKVREHAQKLADADPYADYKARPGLGQPRLDEKGMAGEKTGGHVSPGEAAFPQSQPKADKPQPKPPAATSPNPGPDPHFNPDGTRKNPVR